MDAIDEMERVDELIECGQSLLIDRMMLSMLLSSSSPTLRIYSWSNEALWCLLHATTVTGASHPSPSSSREGTVRPDGDVRPLSV